MGNVNVVGWPGVGAVYCGVPYTLVTQLSSHGNQLDELFRAKSLVIFFHYGQVCAVLFVAVVLKCLTKRRLMYKKANN